MSGQRQHPPDCPIIDTSRGLVVGYEDMAFVIAAKQAPDPADERSYIHSTVPDDVLLRRLRKLVVELERQVDGAVDRQEGRP